MNEATVFDVANWFLAKEPMSHKKLQKMVYYSYAWCLTLLNDSADDISYKLFNDSKPEAWIHGPVFYSLWNKYRGNKWADLPLYTNKVYSFNSEETDILTKVLKCYGVFSGNDLERKTHKEQPWIKARGSKRPEEPCRELLSDADIFVQCMNSEYLNEIFSAHPDKLNPLAEKDIRNPEAVAAILEDESPYKRQRLTDFLKELNS